MYRFLLSRQWVFLTLLGLVMIPAMAELGFWQLHRHDHRVANNKIIAASLRTAPAPVESVTGPGATVPRQDLYRTVTATGRFDTAHEVVARQRTDADGNRIGYHVITPLTLANGRTVLVNRGWIAPGDDLTAFPEIPGPPAGEVTVTGRLRPDETSKATGIRNKHGLPARQIQLISGAEAAKQQVPGELLGGYLELVGTTPGAKGPQPELIPEPDHSGIGPHLAYAVQWWLFAAMVPVGWVVLVRRRRAEILAERAGQRGDGGDPPHRPHNGAALAV
ncbi:SURF1 family protein [Streptomyces sp. NBC_01476]|uniref:SURF1 family cytochrome oxidase biogenesis protein n=1 Tax=Streptomyces sp. NBC_01476 TaxID=2903881 RepID=UPI002E2F98BB|nr:SURF1 family protein [Streptomyces sp. NBC_01476]